MYVKFNSLTFKNILSFGNTPTTIRLDTTDATLIVGKNGCGKSSIIEALTFGLFGKPFRKINKPQLVNRINRGHALVTVELEAGGSQFKIVRGIKPAVFEIYRDGKLIEQSASTYDYQDYLETNVLRMNYETFIQIVVLGNASYTQFMSLKPNERRNVVEQIMNLRTFTDMAELLKKQIAENNKYLDHTKIQLASAEDKATFFKNNVAKIAKGQDKLLAEKQNKLDSARKQLEVVRDTISKNIEKINLLSQQIKEAKSHINERKDAIRHKGSTAQAERAALVAKKELLQHDKCDSCEQEIVHDHKVDMIAKIDSQILAKQKTIEAVSSSLEQIAAKEAKIETAVHSLDKLKRKDSSEKTTALHLESQIRELEREVRLLSAQQEIRENTDEQLEELTNEIERLKNDRSSLVEKASLFKAIVPLLKDDGIKADIIRSYIGIINKIVNKYLIILDFYISFELDQNFNEIIRSPSYEKFSYNSFSEGEKFRVDLSLLMAWRDIAKIKNSCSCNLLFLDETLDSSLDMQGGDSVSQLIEQLTGDGNTVFVISHREAMIDRFENVMHVQKVNGFSTIEVQ